MTFTAISFMLFYNWTVFSLLDMDIYECSFNYDRHLITVCWINFRIIWVFCFSGNRKSTVSQGLVFSRSGSTKFYEYKYKSTSLVMTMVFIFIIFPIFHKQIFYIQKPFYNYIFVLHFSKSAMSVPQQH